MNTPFIVAEIGAAHNGGLDAALQLCHEAKHAGADAVKIQTWHEMTLSNKAIKHGPWAGLALQDLYAMARTPLEWHKPIFDMCKQLDIVCFSSAFDRESVDFLEALDCPIYKIASFEIIDLDLIRYVAKTGKRMIMSTGMATEVEIDMAVEAAGEANITLLKCTSAYPAPAEHCNLVTMAAMAAQYKCPVGLSDHTRGSAVATLAAGMGAAVIEKHLGLDESGLDGGFCMLPGPFKRMVNDCRIAAEAMGEPRFGPSPAEKDSLQFRRSMWVVKDVLEGEPFTDENVRCMRPNTGIHPHEWENMKGFSASRVCMRGEPLLPEMILTEL